MKQYQRKEIFADFMDFCLWSIGLFGIWIVEDIRIKLLSAVLMISIMQNQK